MNCFAGAALRTPAIVASCMLAGCGAATSTDALPSIHDACAATGPSKRNIWFLYFELDRDNAFTLAESCVAAANLCRESNTNGCEECRTALVAQVYGLPCPTVGLDLLWNIFGPPTRDLPVIAEACQGWRGPDIPFHFSNFASRMESGVELEDSCAAVLEDCSTRAESNCIQCESAVVAQLYGQECSTVGNAYPSYRPVTAGR